MAFALGAGEACDGVGAGFEEFFDEVGAEVAAGLVRG